MCNFFGTQKQQKTGNWHCGILLIVKMPKSVTKHKENGVRTSMEHKKL
jgi:hypothetical protein